MKRLILAVMILAFIAAGTTGCLPATQTEIQTLTDSVKNLMGGVDDLQETTKQLAADNLIEAEKFKEINDNIDKVQEHTKIIVKDVETAEDPVEAISKGWDASKPFNPYYGYGAAIIAILKAVQLGRQKKDTENRYAAAKVGMDKFKNENPDKAKELYEDVGEARKAKKIA